MRLNHPTVLAEVTAAFQVYEKALNANDVASLTALFWESPLTIRFGIGENLYGHDAITAFRHARPNIDLRRTLSNTVITTYGDDFATANTEFSKRDTGRCGRQSQTWMRTEAGWRVVSAHVSFLPAQD
jgi:ketosteroid isomerase-like protein